MHRHGSKIRLVVVSAVVGCLVAAAATPVSAAGRAVSGNVCGMVTAKQAAAVHIKLSCTQQKTVQNSQGTIQTAVWGPNKITGPRLSVGIWKLSNAAFLAALKAGHASGKSVGIGNWSRESGLANGKTSDGVAFVIHGYFVLIALTTPANAPLSTPAPLIALAKAVAKHI